MRVYTRVYQKFSTKENEPKIKNSYFDSSSSALEIADKFMDCWLWAKHHCSKIEASLVLASEEQKISIHSDVLAALKSASIGDIVCKLSFVDSSRGTEVYCFVVVDEVTFPFSSCPFIGARQTGRQEVYDFIKGFLQANPDIDAVISCAAAKFNLNK